MRRFHLLRLEDETGISGTGVVTNGIEFSDGTVVMSWNTDTTSVAIYRCMDDVITIHGHQGKTVLQWADDETFEVDPDFLNSSQALTYLTW